MAKIRTIYRYIRAGKHNRHNQFPPSAEADVGLGPNAADIWRNSGIDKKRQTVGPIRPDLITGPVLSGKLCGWD